MSHKKQVRFNLNDIHIYCDTPETMSTYIKQAIKTTNRKRKRMPLQLSHADGSLRKKRRIESSSQGKECGAIVVKEILNKLICDVCNTV